VSQNRLAVNPRLVRDNRPVERVGSLVLPTRLTELLTRVHGADAVSGFEVPSDYGHFVRTHGGGLWTPARDGSPDAYGWKVLRWSQALTATIGVYEAMLEVEEVDERDEAMACVQKVGMWLEVGRSRDRHYHYVCCDRSRGEFGQVHDANDGDPTTGLVPDRIWDGFRQYIA